ncbi:MAG: hypothetical protein KAW66_07520, partial [Candidatus Lokiarchaeota archaeon]|nr:hypothetical protein [Candidatus Lokiarchaeota archaeon]
GYNFGYVYWWRIIDAKKKMDSMGIFIIISIGYEYFLFSNPIASFAYVEPSPLGSDIIDTSSNYSYPTSYFLIVFILSILVFNGFGFLVKAKQATGILRKKFLYLSIGFIVFAVIVTFDSILPPMIALFIVRFGIIISSILLYLGIKS